MRKQITRFSIHQTSTVLGILYFVLSAIFFIPYAIFILFSPEKDAAFILFIAPFIYGIMGYLFSVLATWVYNQVAAFLGGIEFTLEDKE